MWNRSDRNLSLIWWRCEWPHFRFIGQGIHWTRYSLDKVFARQGLIKVLCWLSLFFLSTSATKQEHPFHKDSTFLESALHLWAPLFPKAFNFINRIIAPESIMVRKASKPLEAFPERQQGQDDKRDLSRGPATLVLTRLTAFTVAKAFTPAKLSPLLSCRPC